MLIFKLIALLGALTGPQFNFTVFPEPYTLLLDKVTPEAVYFCQVDSSCMDITTFEEYNDFVTDKQANAREFKQR